jgi:hypothetical protein
MSELEPVVFIIVVASANAKIRASCKVSIPRISRYFSFYSSSL